MIQPSCVSLTELDLCHQPAFPNIFYHTMQSYVLQAFEIVATTAAERRLRTARPRQGSNMRKKRRYPSDISSFSHLIESTRRRRTSGGRSTATTGAERRHSNRSSPAGLEHRKKSHPSDDPFSISLRARDVAERPGDVRLRRPERSVEIRTVRTRQGSNIEKRVIHWMTLFSISLRARDGIRTRDPRLGKAILHH